MSDGNYFAVLRDFEQVVSRKNKNKNKRKFKQKNVEQNSSNSDADVDIQVAVEEFDETNSNQTDDFEDRNNIENSNETEYCELNDRISTDAQLIRKPKIQQSEETYEKLEKLSFEENEESKENNYKYPEIEVSEVTTAEVKENYNVRALARNADTYELETFEKNVLIIFNQENVEGYKPRYGTEKDVDALKNTFKKFGFEVTEYKDLTKKEISDTLEAFTSQDFTDYGCVGVAVLTHGSEYGLLRAKDQQYSEIEIINYFKVHDKPTLVTKPKFIIIQACRGTEIIPGAVVMRSRKIRTDLDSSKEPYILPVEADMLILHSSYIRSPSYRDEVFGSWFIQSLCNKINQLAATHDVESIITQVKREVAIDKEHEVYNKRTLEMQVNKQMPVMTTTLIRKLYFKKFGDPPTLSLTLTDSGSCQCKNGSNEVLDSAPPSTPSPMLVQFGPCSCFLEHFDYIKNCLRYFVEDCSEDETAHSFLELAETFEEGVKFNAAKEKLAKAMCKHLTANAKHCQYYKYLYFYKHA